MDKDIIRDLYYGQLSPWEMTFHKSSEYAKALTEVVACGDRLRELLNEADRTGTEADRSGCVFRGAEHPLHQRRW